jgi:tetratricopeptide (TPR) repeat protein
VIKEALQLDDKAAAKTFLQRYGEVAREVKNTKDEAESYEKLGDIEFNADNNKEAFELYDKALALRKGTEREWWTIDYIASAHWSLGEYNKAAERFNEEIEILRKLESQRKNSSSKFQPV